uniref:AMP-dependent synthetase and ligase n=1 Tax=Cyanothece sp. (strain PCC 7425 / ATCC 29141) TaxID=395961 RepID=B8HKY7_CYAP4
MIAPRAAQQLPCKTLVDRLRHYAQSSPQQVAYRFQRDNQNVEELTYGDLDRQARTIAAYLQAQVPLGDRILLIYPPGLDFIAAFLGCLSAGMVAVPTRLPRHGDQLAALDNVAIDAGTTLFLTTQESLTELSVLMAERSLPLAFPDRWSGLATDTLVQIEDDWQIPDLNGEQLAFLQYTSGSTGNPKGVMVSHANILHNSEIIYQAFGHSAQSEGVIWLPPFHDMGLIGGILQPLYGGFPVILMSPEAVMIRPLTWLKAITRYRATTSGGPNFAYDWCVQRIKPEQLNQLDLSSWEIAFTGAEPVRPDTLKQFAAKFACCGFRAEAFYPCYGMAETTLFITGGTKGQQPPIVQVDAKALEQHQVIPSQEQGRMRELVSCGYAWSDQRVVVVDSDALTACGEGQVGEIWVAGESVSQGYWNKPWETELVFQAYLSDTGEGPFLRTGDLGVWLQGELYITGRLKDIIIIRGRNYYPQDFELTVQRSHPALQTEGCAAFAVEVGQQERLILLVELKRQHGLTEPQLTSLVQTIQQRITQEHEIGVDEIVLLRSGTIPKTSSGKIRRRSCRDAYLSGELTTNLQGEKVCI